MKCNKQGIPIVTSFIKWAVGRAWEPKPCGTLLLKTCCEETQAHLPRELNLLQMRVSITYPRSFVRGEHAFALKCLSFVMLGRKSKLYLAFARLLNY